MLDKMATTTLESGTVDAVALPRSLCKRGGASDSGSRSTSNIFSAGINAIKCFIAFRHFLFSKLNLNKYKKRTNEKQQQHKLYAFFRSAFSRASRHKWKIIIIY